MKKDIYIGLLTPWGVPLIEKTLQNWSDVDINRFMELHRLRVYSPKAESNGSYYFQLIRTSTYLALHEEIEKKNIEVQKIKSVKLLGHWTDQVQQISINYSFSLRSSFINMQKYLVDEEDEVLIINESKSINTVINLTGISPYIILFFDDELKFTGASYSIQNGNGDFRITTAYKHLLFVRMPHDLKLDIIKHLAF
jgi:hypothetical protein